MEKTGTVHAVPVNAVLWSDFLLFHFIPVPSGKVEIPVRVINTPQKRRRLGI